MSNKTYAGYTAEQIRAAANAATPGPWSVPDGADEIIAWVEIPVGGALNCGMIHCDHSLSNARHVATANPETVIALLDRIAELERAQAKPVAWSMSKKTVLALAAELVRGAECMADDETELTLEVLPAGTVRDDDDTVNANPVFAISIADYPEEGVYPIDPCNPTAGREPGQSQQAEPLTRFCPGCGSVGSVDDGFKDCCPDGSHARMIPEAITVRCHELFEIAVQGVLAAAPTPEGGAA